MRGAVFSHSMAHAAWLSAVAALLGCSSPELESTNFSCTNDADCGSGQMCADHNGDLACLPIPEVPIRIGMSAPLQGPSQALGNEMRRGINAMLKRVNEAGGVHGRQIVLDALNDNYDPTMAIEMTRQLLDIQEPVEDPNRADVRGGNGVFALVGNVGTPTMLATAPIATKNKVVFFGPFTGAQAYLRDDTKSPYVYNYRAGYFDETAAMVEYIHKARIPSIIDQAAPDHRRIMVFAQNDSYGDSGYQGVVTAYNANVAPLPDQQAIFRIGYEREDVSSVDPAVIAAGGFLDGVLERGSTPDSRESVAIFMIDTYQPAERFIRGVKTWINMDVTRARRLDVVFLNVSFVGSDALAGALSSTPESYTDVVTGDERAFTENVFVTQVVPDYQSQSAGVVQYREDIAAFDSGAFSFTSLEGYIVARLFTTALDMNGPNLTTDNFIKTLDTRVSALDLGIGTELSFSSTDHQASDTVWISEIQSGGRFEVPFVWHRDSGIEN